MASTSTDRRQGVNAGAAVKVPCRAATTAAITLSGNQTIDGVFVITGDRVLVKNQTAGETNGIYVVDTGAWIRDKDFDGTFDAKKGTFVYVHSGSTAGGFWYVNTSDPITVGTTSLTFAQASTYLATISAYMQTVITSVDAAAARLALAAPGLAVANTFTGTNAFDSTVAITSDISPAQLVANTNDWAPTGLSTASVIRFSTDARRNITGLTGGSDGRIVIVRNVGTFPGVFTFKDVLSATANRFAFACTLGGGQSMQIQYDGILSLWYPVSVPEPIGTIKDFGNSTMPADYLAIDQDVSRTTYAALYNEWGTTWGSGDLSTTFGLWVGKGRARIAAGTGTITEAVAAASVSVASDNFTVGSNNKKWITGQPVVLTTTGGLPAPLALATTYYLVRVSATLIQFATTLANAQNGTVIDITTQGTGTHTVTGTLTARTIGEQGGEEDHAMSLTELLLHGHTDTGHAHSYQNPVGAGISGYVGGGQVGGGTTGTASAAITNTGGNAAMNNMQPFSVVNVGVKYC